MESVMHGWVVEAITRRAGNTLILHQKYNVAIEDENQARAAVLRLTGDCYSVRLEARDLLPEETLHSLGMGPGEIRRQ
jgi:hypothetical protein